MSMGKLSEFNIRTGNWSLYVERAEMYYKANKVADELRLPSLIAAMGDEAYELLSNLTSPCKPSDKTYDDVVLLMKNHLQPKPSFMAERYRFRQRRQHVGESINLYISELKKTARYCEFGTALEDHLRDQLVCGLRSDVIRQRLFAEEQLQYAKAVKISCAMEAAERDAAAVERTGEGGPAASGSGGGGGAEGAVHAVGTARTQARGRPRPLPMAQRLTSDGYNSKSDCTVCGASEHRSDECRYSKFICGKCRQRGHLRRVCPTRGRNPRPRRGSLQAHHVLAEQGQALQQDELSGEDEPPSSGDSSLEEHDFHQLCLNGYKPT